MFCNGIFQYFYNERVGFDSQALIAKICNVSQSFVLNRKVVKTIVKLHKRYGISNSENFQQACMKRIICLDIVSRN